METDLKSYRSEFVPVSCNQGLTDVRKRCFTIACFILFVSENDFSVVWILKNSLVDDDFRIVLWLLKEPFLCSYPRKSHS